MATLEPTAGVFLKSVELRLLRCTLSQETFPPTFSSQSPPASRGSLRSLVEHLVGLVEQGLYADGFSFSDASRLVFSFVDSWEFEDTVDSAARFYGEVEQSVDAFLRKGQCDAWLQVLDEESDDVDIEGRCALVMCLGVAALLAFTQQNVTGPTGSFSPYPLLFAGAKKDGANNGGGHWDIWAWNQVASVGSDVQGKLALLQYIVYAKILLGKIIDFSLECERCWVNGCRSIYWWLCRVFLLQQRILDELSSSLHDLLQPLKDKTLLQFGESKNVASYWGYLLHEGEALAIASLAQLEAGIIDYKYGRVDSSRLCFKLAEESCGLQFTVTGALGFRTIHQEEAKPQLILATNIEQVDARKIPLHPFEAQSDLTALERMHSDDLGLNNSSDILMTPRLVENMNCPGTIGDLTRITKDIVLTSNQQAIILAQCLHLSKRSRDDELSRWEMAPYIEAIDSQEFSCYTIRNFCDILRIRWESTRCRTKQRALLMMDKLVEVINEASPTAAQRSQLAFAVYIPTFPALKKEYCELLVSCGMIGEALKIFEDLELWDSLIFCYQLLGKKAAAVDLIKVRLQDVPNDPRLWCSLGDVTNTDAYYEKALEVSNNRSARAKRSLARSAYSRGDYTLSKELWESALALNSLYPDGWFALGAAALKARDIDKALDGFTRAVQLDPDNGEAWNNVACLHMVKKKSKAAFIAFKEALKFRRNSWQLWENFSHAAFDIGNFRQTLEAVKMVLDLSENKHVDIELLDKILRKLEERNSTSVASLHNDIESLDKCTEADSSQSFNDSSDESHLSVEILTEPREFEFLLDMLGQILQQIIKAGGQGDIWGLYALWHKIKGNLAMCSEALLKQVRSFQGSELWHDRERFKKFTHASLQLCKVYMEIASSTGSRRELTMAEMHLRSSVKQAINFSDTEELRDLKVCLDEVKKQLDASSNEGVLEE